MNLFGVTRGFRWVPLLRNNAMSLTLGYRVPTRSQMEAIRLIVS